MVHRAVAPDRVDDPDWGRDVEHWRNVRIAKAQDVVFPSDCQGGGVRVKLAVEAAAGWIVDGMQGVAVPDRALRGRGRGEAAPLASLGWLVAFILVDT